MKFFNADTLEIKFKLKKYEKYFDDMFKNIDTNIKLDIQQRKAVLLNDCNLLVVAGAGSGKTTTMVAKVKYLIDCCNYKQSDIAVISFTKKVEEELKKIIHEEFGLKGVNIFTFHALGLKILNQGGENIKEIADDKAQYKIFSNYIKEVLFKNKEKFTLFNNSFGKYLYFGDQWKNFSNFEDFHNFKFLRKAKLSGFKKKDYINNLINDRKKYKKTIRGEYIASKEEVDIANFLYINGIDYQYEKRYERLKNKLYRPDFYISQLENQHYIEHFGVDQYGHNGMYSESELNKYLDNLKIKQNFHNQTFNRGMFIVTYSKYDDNKGYLEHLEEELIKKGYSFFKRSDDEIFEMLNKTSYDGYFSRFIDKVLIPFISLYKQQGYQLKDFDELINNNTDILKNQLIVMKDFFEYYEKRMLADNLIDFEDMINRAYHIMPTIKEKQLGVDFKYLIIDEYQDVSKQRLNLVRKISDLFDAKIMAVGDDWQTIFGYSGSRIDLFRDFQQSLDNAKSIPIENTYRNSQELIDIAGDFILKNTDQINKSLKSNKHRMYPIELVFYDDSNKLKTDINRSIEVDQILTHINNNYPGSKTLLLGRYNKDIYKIQNNELFIIKKDSVIWKKNKELQIDFLTVHKSKGMGYDNCILLDLNDDIYGFPSKIEDIPVIKLIKPNIVEPIDFPEERRLFYVALTRTKNKIFILVPKSKESIFSKEIKIYENVREHKKHLIK
ncbi:MAG: UvrD-helicase domain-containing protein [Bacilli bacterium]|nr:UvrD-helicase domain-containing protein [Bacilli bacterium]MDD4607505.1 UvrD-helicase domain-containing protein [Bacilli bacterium]